MLPNSFPAQAYRTEGGSTPMLVVQTKVCSDTGVRPASTLTTKKGTAGTKRTAIKKIHPLRSNTALNVCNLCEYRC